MFLVSGVCSSVLESPRPPGGEGPENWHKEIIRQESVRLSGHADPLVLS